jgi:hypothetical protein
MIALSDLLAWLPLIALGIGLVLLPGLAARVLLGLWAGRRDPTLGAPDGLLGVLLDGLGLSLALWPLWLLYARLTGIPVTRLTTSLVLLVAALVLIGGLAWQWRRAGRAPGRFWNGRTAAYALLPLAVLTAAALILRFIAVNHLLVPNWGDSLHHTLITQLFLEQRGVPRGYAPYAPVYSFTYHFGFHGLAALWAWMSGQTAWSAVISVGQILNALAVPAAYVLTRELFRSRAAALASAVVVGFLSGMPTQYVNWGRYTQLAGQVLLPFALVWFLRWMEAPRDRVAHPRDSAGRQAGLKPAPTARNNGGRLPGRWGDLPRLALAVLGAAGLGLTHDRILIFYALFVVAYILVMGWRVVRAERGAARRAGLAALLGRVLAVAVPGGILFAPWLGNLLADYLPGLFNRLGRVTSTYIEDYSGWAFLTAYIGWVLPLLAVAGVAACLIGGPARARRMALLVALWTGLLVLASRPDALGLPGAGALGTFTVGIALYLPLGTLAGPGLARPLLAGLPWLRRNRPDLSIGALRMGAGGLVVLAALALTVANPGARTTDPSHAYVTPDDVRVINWIAANTPPGARFLISAKSSYQGRAITAQDAGMWLPLLAGQGRGVSVPPLSAGSEGRQAEDFAARTEALYQAGLHPTAPDSVALLRREHIGYVFIGEQTPTISSTLLLKDTADYCLLARAGGSAVFRVKQDALPCPPPATALAVPQRDSDGWQAGFKPAPTPPASQVLALEQPQQPHDAPVLDPAQVGAQPGQFAVAGLLRGFERPGPGALLGQRALEFRDPPLQAPDLGLDLRRDRQALGGGG